MFVKKNSWLYFLNYSGSQDKVMPNMAKLQGFCTSVSCTDVYVAIWVHRNLSSLGLSQNAGLQQNKVRIRRTEMCVILSYCSMWAVECLFKETDIQPHVWFLFPLKKTPMLIAFRLHRCLGFIFFKKIFNLNFSL